MNKAPIWHADGCTTNLGIIGATCNCGSERQRDVDHEYYLKAFVEWAHSPCPHKYVRLADDSLVPVEKGECDKCLEALLKEAEK